MISNRIKTTLREMISESQTGFIPGRHISENIRTALDVMSHVDCKQIAAVMILVDFEKAFDRVEYHSLYAAFKCFNFRERMLEWIKLLFTDMQLCTVNKENSSPWFSVTRGLFQGNPLGPFAFIYLVELLAIMMKRNPKIEGIRIGQIVYLLSQFADDLTLYLPLKQKVWEEVMNVFARFEAISGMKIN